MIDIEFHTVNVGWIDGSLITDEKIYISTIAGLLIF